MGKIILIRHGEAEGNHLRVFQGQYDAPLSEKGRVQIDLVALRLRNTPCTVIYTSPLARAKETAQAIAQYHAVPLVEDSNLMEIAGGVWENVPWAELPALYPEDSYHWLEEPWHFAPKGGEPMSQLYQRIYNAILTIAKRHPEETVFVVTHGCALRNLLCKLQFDDIHRLNDVFWCDNTAVTVLEFDQEFQGRITLSGDASHLDASTSTIANQVWWREELTLEERFA